LVFLTSAPASAQWPEQWWLGPLGVTDAQAVATGSGITVGVVDSGVVGSIGDLTGQVLPGVDLTGGGNAQADPGDGCGDVGGCFSHGTDMATLIAGTGKGAGMLGVAPGAKIYPVKVGSTGTTDPAELVAQGIMAAAKAGARIINVSLGGPSSCDPYDAAAIKYAYQHDIIVVAAAGNVAGPVSYPANCPGALAISAVDSNDNIWADSATGPEIDFANAGVNTVQESLQEAKLYKASGTSDAAAITSGELALIWSKFPTDTARQIITRALYSVHNGIGGGVKKNGIRVNDQIGYGIILPNYAVQAVPATAKNPIYDKWQAELGPPTTASTSPTSAPGPTTAPSQPPTSSSTAPTTAAPTSAVTGPPTSVAPKTIGAGGNFSTPSRGGSNTGLIIGIAAAVIVILAIGILLLRRRDNGGGPGGTAPPTNQPWPPQPPKQR
jgi:hypothetical protein